MAVKFHILVTSQVNFRMWESKGIQSHTTFSHAYRSSYLFPESNWIQMTQLHLTQSRTVSTLYCDVATPTQLSSSETNFTLVIIVGINYYLNRKYIYLYMSISSVQFSHSVVADSLQPHESQHARPPCPSPTPRVHPNSRPSSRWFHPAISSSVIPFFSCPQSLPASVFSNESALHMRWPKYWSFSFSIIPSKEHSGLISFRKDWLDLLAVQGTLKSLLQHHSSKAPILQHSAFFTVQLSHPYMTTGKTIALTRRTSVGKVMSLLFNMLSRLVITW